jgi:threonine/homoserine/homoserine lactone efflux protein
MTSQLFWQGYAVGLLAAIPLGPMGMVCLQRTLTQGRTAGLVSASGLTLAAALWCVAAAQGLSAFAGFLAGRKTVCMIALGGFLVVAGAIGLVQGRRRIESPPVSSYGTLAGHFFTSLAGVLFNPITFLTMTAVLAILGGSREGSGFGGMAWLAVAVFAGGMSVWLALTQGVTLMRDRLGKNGGLRVSLVLNGGILLLGIIYIVRPLIPQMTG